jgi:hypothetical protein
MARDGSSKSMAVAATEEHAGESAGRLLGVAMSDTAMLFLLGFV